jgi:OHCU decarboxylase
MCHPDLAGKLAVQGNLTPESTSEQSNAGLLNLPKDEFDRLSSFNRQYNTKFRFPFVICVGENKKDAIFNGIQERLKNSPEIELENGIEQVKRIVNLRLNKLVKDCNKL